MFGNSRIKIGFTAGRYKYGSRNYSGINVTVTAKTTRNTPRESDTICDDDGRSEKRTVSLRLKEGFEVFEHE